MYKIRTIVGSSSGKRNFNVKGITIPNNISVFFPETFFSIELYKNGSSFGILLLSGCQMNITDKELESYKYEDCIGGSKW